MCEVLSAECPAPVHAIGIRDHFGEVAKTDYLLKKYKMTPEDIAQAALHVVAMKKQGGNK